MGAGRPRPPGVARDQIHPGHRLGGQIEPDEAATQGVDGVIAKPYRAATLLNVVAEVAGGRAAIEPVA